MAFNYCNLWILFYSCVLLSRRPEPKRALKSTPFSGQARNAAVSRLVPTAAAAVAVAADQRLNPAGLPADASAPLPAAPITRPVPPPPLTRVAAAAAAAGSVLPRLDTALPPPPLRPAHPLGFERSCFAPMAASDEMAQKDEDDMKDEKQAEKEYADFEARVKRTIYIDHLSPLVTSQVIKASLAQCANVVNTEFIENYTIEYEIPAAALVEVDNVSQAQAAVDLMNNFPFMLGGMPRPVRAAFAKPEMFPDRPRKPGLKIEFSWVKQGDPGYDGMNKLKGLMRRQEAENMALIKNQLEEEKELAAQQQETLVANSNKYDMLENLVNNGEITKLAQHYKVKLGDD
ncbi:hypothetical protein VPH35_041518 [Triticum aestivum]